MIIQTEKAPVGGCQPGPAASPLYVSGFIVRGPPKLLGQTHKGLDRRYDDDVKRRQRCIPIATRLSRSLRVLAKLSHLPPLFLGFPLHRGRLWILALDPIWRATGTIPRVLALRHNTVQPELARRLRGRKFVDCGVCAKVGRLQPSSLERVYVRLSPRAVLMSWK